MPRTDDAALRKRVEELTAERRVLTDERDRLGAERELWNTERSQLTAEREQLAARSQKLARERDEYHKLYLALLETCRKLELGLLGQKAERLSSESSQLTMQLLGALLSDAPAAPAEDSPVEDPLSDEGDEGIEEPQPADPDAAAPKRKPGRRALPQNLPRVEIEVLPPEVERAGTDQFERIGEESAEVIERRRASLVVVRIKRGKWVRKDRERNAETEVLVAEPPELPIERGIAGPGVLAETIVRRFDDHQPANRQERTWEREGFELSRATICEWHFRLHVVVMPLLVAMWKDALSAPYLCTDATGVLVQAKDKCRRGHFFTVVVPERYLLYAYSPTHDGAAVDKLLKGYKGTLLADAHIIYDHLYRTGEIIEAACWAHTRRYFFKSLESDPQRAHEALALINGLFEIERELARAPTGKRRAERARIAAQPDRRSPPRLRAHWAMVGRLDAITGVLASERGVGVRPGAMETWAQA